MLTNKKFYYRKLLALRSDHSLVIREIRMVIRRIRNKNLSTHEIRTGTRRLDKKPTFKESIRGNSRKTQMHSNKCGRKFRKDQTY